MQKEGLQKGTKTQRGGKEERTQCVLGHCDSTSSKNKRQWGVVKSMCLRLAQRNVY